jgi:hypothetical protein
VDWGKAKTILITLLLALNALLFGSIAARAYDIGAGDSIYDDLGQILDRRGVTVLCGFPKDVRDSELLIYEDSAEYVERIAASLSGGAAVFGGDGVWRDPAGTVEIERLGRESFVYRDSAPERGAGVPFGAAGGGAAGGAADAAGDAALQSSVKGFLADRGVDMSPFALDYFERGADGATLQYVQTYKGMPVFDSVVRVRADAAGGVEEIEVRHRGIKGVSRNKPMNVIPAYQVVLKNYRERGQAISSIDIGFMGQNTSADNQFVESEEGAVWRIRSDGGADRFFEALYGDEIFPAAP